MTKSKSTAKRELPPDVLEADLAHFPEGTTSRLTFYLVGGSAARKDRGWVLITFRIVGACRRQPEQYYGIRVKDEAVCGVRRGPHILQVVTVYVSKKNVGRLQKYIDLHQKGLD